MTFVQKFPAPLAVCIVAFWCLASSPTATAQGAGAPPPPVESTLTTKDGVELRITYYPSNAGREAVPVILLHDFNETRAVLDPLANLLHDPPPAGDSGRRPFASRAVVAVDLRGHGDSKTGFDPGGAPFELAADRLELADFQNMVLFDLEAVRSFLVDENDAGRLNLNKLCVVGCGMGANIATLWAARDWATPPLAVRKQGQDVKALVLVSPRWNFRGLTLVAPLKFPPIQQALSVYLAYGADDRDVTKDCLNIKKILDRRHPEPPADQAYALKDFFHYAPRTKLQGSALLKSREFQLTPRIADFVQARLGAKPFPYARRRN